MIRAVIDTNVVVSGLLFGGLPYKVVRKAIERKFVFITSPILMDELERVMKYQKFGLSKSEVETLLGPLFFISEIIVPIHTIDVIKKCPADNRVLECAAEGDCSMIVSGDRRDLLSLKSYRHIKIITARQFLDLV